VLQDGCWYLGTGRNSSIGRWDARSGCFWVVVFNNLPNPALYPRGSIRQVRLKQEYYSTTDAGTFTPLRTLVAG